METARSGLVDIVREYLEVHERMTELFTRFRSGSLEFSSVRELCADDDRSPLFRLKERCHTLFRRGEARQRTPMRRAALFDLAVGSLFHEAMKFRENVYQLIVYAPKVRELRESARADDPDDAELFREFDKIQSAAEARMDEAVQETESLLVHTGEQLWGLLRGRRDGLLTRYLIEQAERIGKIDGGDLEALLAQMHGDPAEAYVAAARSYLDSAHFGHALGVLSVAEGAGALEGARVAHLEAYARGMQSFLAGEYTASLDQLETWVDAGPDTSETGYASLAQAAVSRMDHLVQDPPVIARSLALAARMEPFVGV